MHHAIDRGAYEQRLIDRGLDFEVGRQAGAHLRYFGLDAIDDVERQRGAVLEDVDQHGALAILPHDVGLRLEAVVNLGDVANVDRAVVAAADRQGVQLGDRARAAVQGHVVFERPDLGGAGGQDQVLGVDRVDHVECRQVLGLQRARVDVHHHRAELAAVGVGHHRALHRGELGAHEAVGEVEDLVFAKGLARQRQLQDRHRRRVVGEDQRRHRTRRKAADDRLRDRDDLRERRGQVGAAVEEHLDHGHAVVRLRLDALDVVDRGRHAALEIGDDPAFHLLGGEAVVAPDDADDRDVDVGEDVGRHPHDRQRADDQDQERQHDERVRAAQGKLDNPHGDEQVANAGGHAADASGRGRRNPPARTVSAAPPVRPRLSPVRSAKKISAAAHAATARQW